MLFIENPYLKEFDAKIVNINTNQITLDQTAFYARSGGQPGDVGRLTTNGMTINIIDTVKDQENNIIHIADTVLEHSSTNFFIQTTLPINNKVYFDEKGWFPNHSVPLPDQINK